MINKRPLGTAGWALVILAVAFQVLATPQVGGNYIRVAAADLVVPFLMLAALSQWVTGKQPWPQWRLPRFHLWLCALTAWLTFELVAGRFYTGSWQSWGLVNKYLGWFVLIAFLFFGAWVGQLANERDQRLFARVLIGWAVAITVVDIVRYVLLLSFNEQSYPRLEGWAGNPNSYGYLLAVVICVVLPATKREPLFGLKWDAALLGIIGSGLFFSGSRSATIGLICGLTLLALTRSLTWGVVLRGATVAAAISLAINWLPAGILSVLTAEHKLSGYQETPYYMRPGIMEDSGVSHRLRITKAALTLLSEHPITGIGLGSFYWDEKRRQEAAPATIHNTALWLATETGLIGLALFSGLCLAMGLALWRAARSGLLDPMSIGGFAALAVMVGASVGMEAMYQRHVWFMVGYALVARPKPRQGDA